MFFGKTLNSSPHTGVEMGTSKLLGKSDQMLERNLALDKGPIQGEVIIVVVCLCFMETGISRGWVGHLA